MPLLVLLGYSAIRWGHFGFAHCKYLVLRCSVYKIALPLRCITILRHQLELHYLLPCFRNCLSFQAVRSSRWKERINLELPICWYKIYFSAHLLPTSCLISCRARAETGYRVVLKDVRNVGLTWRPCKNREVANYEWVGFQDAGALTVCLNVVSDDIRWGTMISLVTCKTQVKLHGFYKYLKIAV